jgi:hypothetical protein
MSSDKNKYKYRKEGDIERRNKKRRMAEKKAEEDEQTKSDMK